MYPLAPPGLSALIVDVFWLLTVSQQGTTTFLDPEDLHGNPMGFKGL